MGRRSGNGVDPFGVIALILVIVLFFATVFGLVVWGVFLVDNNTSTTDRVYIYERRTIPHFSRPAIIDCGSFTCANVSDPNPTYFHWSSSPTNDTLLDGYFFFDSTISGDVFDIGNPDSVTLKIAGVYELTVSAAVISFDNQTANVGVIMMSTTLPVLTNPAEGGALVILASSPILGGVYVDNLHFTVVRHFEAGTVLRIARITTHDVVFTPSTVWTGTLLGKH